MNSWESVSLLVFVYHPEFTMLHIPSTTLWLGHTGDVEHLQTLLDGGNAAVVDVAANEPLAWMPRDTIYCRFPLFDGMGNSLPLLRLAITTLAGLLQGQFSTLVYCSAGVSRSPALAAAALSLLEGKSPVEWLQKIASLKPVDVHPAFWNEVETVLADLRKNPG